MIKTLFADVILPLAVPNLYTYRIPLELNDEVTPGKRVAVQFGKRKIYSAIIRHLHERPPVGYEAKYILSVLDPLPIVNEKQFLLWDWIASYYLCTVGEVMNAALPAALKLQSETKIRIHPDFAGDFTKLNEKEYQVAAALEEKKVMSADEVAKIAGLQHALSLTRSLIEKGVAEVEEELKEKFRPKVVRYVSLNPAYSDEEELKKLFDKLEKRAPKQLEVLMKYISVTDSAGYSGTKVEREELLKDQSVSASALNDLIKKGVFDTTEKIVGRFGEFTGESAETVLLNDEQGSALEEIKKQFESKEVILLHGVTSSGKTELYIRLIRETIDAGKQVLYLLPEIALTAQIITRLQKHFGNSVGVYHSKFSDNERVEVWNDTGTGITPGKLKIILGARSAVFLPYTHLGLIIIDEEHENTFKQFDPAPRYHARDTAIYLAHLHGAKTLLGSATPSLETYHNAMTKKYGLVNLTGRFGGMQMPEIVVVDIKELSKRKQMKSHFSPLLIEQITHALQAKEQIILFQNRRGFAPVLECSSCAEIPRCINCDVSLTYHKHSGRLHCHYCGYSQKPPSHCPACGSADIKMKGFGTEKIEDELSIFFPDAKIARLDLDATRTRNAYRHIITEFENRNIDILVGTQMVTKGLDFDNVSTVGILNADSLLGYPDFRSYERGFDLMAQVSGRSGRKNKRGKVIIQTWHPGHSIIQFVVNNDYEGMYHYEIQERGKFKYPPFHRLIQLTIKHKDPDALQKASAYLASELRDALGKSRILGPEFPLVTRIKNYYLKNILIKIEKEGSVKKAKNILSAALSSFAANKDFKSVIVQCDVDPA